MDSWRPTSLPLVGRIQSERATIWAVARQACSVAFKDERGIRHAVEVEDESVFEAAILPVRAFRKAQWIGSVVPAMALELEVLGGASPDTADDGHFVSGGAVGSSRLGSGMPSLR
jgi:hypothetical protein